jgi:hypothetical protein
MSSMKQRVAVLGASDKPERYSHQAVRLLLDHGHQVVPVHPSLSVILDLEVAPDLPSIEGPIDTLTLYVGPAISVALADSIESIQPGRVLFNPGTENPDLENRLRDTGIHTLRACTLVLLRTGQF